MYNSLVTFCLLSSRALSVSLKVMNNIHTYWYTYILVRIHDSSYQYTRLTWCVKARVDSQVVAVNVLDFLSCNGTLLQRVEVKHRAPAE